MRRDAGCFPAGDGGVGGGGGGGRGSFSGVLLRGLWVPALLHTIFRDLSSEWTLCDRGNRDVGMTKTRGALSYCVLVGCPGPPLPWWEMGRMVTPTQQAVVNTGFAAHARLWTQWAGDTGLPLHSVLFGTSSPSAVILCSLQT